MKSRNKIAKTSNGHCVERGISVMRLALGYKTGLPEKWDKRQKTALELIKYLPEAFPSKQIIVWFDDPNYLKNNELPDNVELGGLGFSGGLDNYLTAFIYYSDKEEDAHFVVGEPVSFSDTPLNIELIFSVEI